MYSLCISSTLSYPFFTPGAHINPAVTLAFASVGRLPLWKVPIYILSQMLAGIIASAVVYGLYYGKL